MESKSGPKDFAQFEEMIKRDSRFKGLPWKLFADPTSASGGFPTLKTARNWVSLNEHLVSNSVDNSACFYFKASFGWCLFCVEINCKSLKEYFPGYGVSEVLNQGQADERLAGSHVEKLRNLLQQNVPVGVHAQVLSNRESGHDFPSLENAVSYAESNTSYTYLTLFCQTPEKRWLIVDCYRQVWRSLVRGVLKNRGYFCLDYLEAKSEIEKLS